MSSRESKSFQDKLKGFFRASKNVAGSFKGRIDFAITTEIEKELSCDTPTPQRLKAIKNLYENIVANRLDDQLAVEKLWLCIADLIQPEQSKECRHCALLFLRHLIQGQYDLLNIMRGQFFRVIVDHNHPEDIHERLELLQTLTSNGKDITYFEEQIFKFMLQWMPTVTYPDLTQEFLTLLVNLIKYNAAYMSKEVISGFVNNTCFLCCYSPASQVVLGCLQVLDAIVCYSIFPHESLKTFISALCRTVNVEEYCQPSWKIMRCVLGTDLGHSALHVMCVALGTGAGGDCGLVRGAVFYLNMSLWGPKRVATLKCTPTQVLPSFLKALEGNQSVVTYEVILATQSLVNKHGQELHEPAWDLIFTILLNIIKQLEGTQSPYHQTVSHLRETITAIEQLYDNGCFNGSIDNMYSVIDACGRDRPENSVLKLIGYFMSQIIPTNHEWLNTLNRLVERYCRHESRVSIRLKVLQALQTIFDQNKFSYEEELLDKVILPNLQHCSTEADPVIRCASSKLLIDIAVNCHSKRFSDLFDILEKLLNRPFELYVTAEPIVLPPETDVSDIKAVAAGVVQICLHKLHQLPSTHAVRAYSAVLNHLQLHYEKPALFEKHPSIRLNLLEWFLSARANSLYHIGFPRKPDDRIIYSPYICIEGGGSATRPSHSPTPQAMYQNPSFLPTQISYVSIRKACKIIITCLKQEKDWSVLSTVLKEIPNVMQNKALVLSKNNNDVDLLATALCSMVMDKSLMLPESLYNTPGKPSRSDFHTAVLPVLTCLAPYHAHLDPQLQQRIIKCMKFGLVVSPCAQQCVTALTIFTLEMRDTMVKLLPEVLLDLSKISATVYIAIPILEFLSTLTRLPKVFASFVGDQYMSVFAILLPYTNPFKYNHYIVSLAHHVIAAWFLKCRLPFRRDFVKFIKHGLHNNILKPFEEGKSKQDFIDLNQDSSSRKRSSSLTEQGSRRRELPTRPALGELRTPQEASNTFHIELTETCIDLMARYTYSPCISAPKRSSTTDFLLSGGQSTAWLLGHKIITVTTSGCSQNALRQGLCERCLMLCKAHADSLQSPYSAGNSGLPGNMDENSSQNIGPDVKRYTKYTLQHSKSNETTNSSSSISDNILFPPFCHNTRSLQSLSGHTTRQNSSENKNDVLPSSPRANPDSEPIPSSQLNLKLENFANKQSSDDKPAVSSVTSRLERVIGSSFSKSSSNSSASASVIGSSSGVIENRPHCACWCGSWAEVHVRGPTGDVSWVIRLQNQVNLDSFLSDVSLNDISSLFLGSLNSGNPQFNCNVGLPYHLGSAASIASSGFADAKSDILSDGDPRSRSGSGGSQPDQLQKSNSDSIVVGASTSGVSGTSMSIIERRPPHAATHCIVPSTHAASITSTSTAMTSIRHHATTGPINIPGSPQRQSSSGTNTDDEDNQLNPNDQGQALLDDQNKSRHPVRRSNSSPEMSSSWKNPFYIRERMEAADVELTDDSTSDMNAQNMHMSSEPQDTSFKSSSEMSGASGPQTSKKGTMKSLTKDMRVSCEAIPEEMSSNTPPHLQHTPHSHHHLMTYNSDPGSTLTPVVSDVQGSSTSSSEKNIVLLSTNREKANTHELLKLSSKPPHSPTPASPRPTNRMQNTALSNRNIQNVSTSRSNSIISTETRNTSNLNLKFSDTQASQQQNLPVDDLPPLSRSKRSNTISVMSPTRKRRDNSSPKPRDSSTKSGVSPAFVFLQLYHGSGIKGASGEDPLLLSGPQHARSVKTLDLVPPLETYRVGVLYVGRGQHDNETKILKNEFGSLRYAEFLQDLGTLISLEDAESMGLFLDVEKGGRDGRFAYVWQDDIMQVHFHVATLMPNNSSDPECNEKRKHIGNDYVSIVYNESGEDFLIQTIKGQFNFACIIIEPLDHGTNKVTIKTKDEVKVKEFLNQTEPKIISDQNVALLARQLALHANLASLISRSLSTTSTVPYASNWLERLRIIKRLRNKLLQERNAANESNICYNSNSSSDMRRSFIEDFTEYT
ncbi:TSC complex subunit tuberin isoform X2 [Arctopsyche grandis]|uniref:TSC complex subunit tuberin isoform X2 n=1 Tax=Arctopsyche grandis TaxID=121162 RepID=UPI00406D7430